MSESMSANDKYDNAETADELTEAARKATGDPSEEEEAELPGEQATAEELSEDRETIAAGADADHLPGTVTQEVPWRGVELEFEEMGDTLDEIGRMENDDDVGEAEMTAFARKRLADKCTDPAADHAYWKQFDLRRNDDVDGILDIVMRLNGVDPEQQQAQAKKQRAEEFRNQ